ncbi:YkvA family protein [Cryobacterium sp. Y62]|uniref:YkvA family protein n=1 Tax=Cryobacterium sp. Y62 TaxID=2048284 RepID=UPI000CE56FC2|nr:YkvA family protein [Cryobacterium sp. Y62]
MTEWWQILLSILLGLVVIWLILVLVLWQEQRKHPGKASLRHLLRLAPDVAWLLKRLAVDRTVPLGVRVWLVVLLVYLVSPIDLIPDFIPILGYADDAIVVAIALRFATRQAGSAAIKRHWPGTPAGLQAVLRLAGLPSSPEPRPTSSGGDGR